MTFDEWRQASGIYGKDESIARLGYRAGYAAAIEECIRILDRHQFKGVYPAMMDMNVELRRVRRPTFP